jgi:predicted RND superfamily exporter protein
MKKALPYLFASVLAAFGLLTLFLSSSVIFDLFGVRAQEGNYVLFIVWANFLSSLFYLSAAYGFIESKKWTASLLGISGIVLLLAFVGLFIHIKAGGTYETKTIGAMAFRITVTLVFSALAYFTITKNKKQ